MSGFDFSIFIPVASELEVAGLSWQPEIGDEVASRAGPTQVSILVDPQGMTPKGLKQVYLWLPTVEQLVMQLEARQAFLFHAGLELSDTAMAYKAVIQSHKGHFEATARSLRTAVASSLLDLLRSAGEEVH